MYSPNTIERDPLDYVRYKVRLTNPVEHNLKYGLSSVWLDLLDWVRLELTQTPAFNLVRMPNSVKLSSISECSIDYAASKARGVPVAFHAVISCTFAGHACTHWALTGVLFVLCAHSSPDWNRKLFVTTNKCHCGQTDIVTQVWAPIFSKTCYNGKKYLLTRNHSGAVRILVKPPLKLQSRSF